MDVVKRGILIGSTTNMGSGLDGVLVGRKLNESTTLPPTIIGVVGTPQMVFTNSIMITHVNRTTNEPSMNSMAAKGYKIANVMNSMVAKAYKITNAMNSKGGY